MIIFFSCYKIWVHNWKIKGVSSLYFPEKFETHQLIIAGVYILLKYLKKYKFYKGDNSVNKYKISIKFGMHMQ